MFLMNVFLPDNSMSVTYMGMTCSPYLCPGDSENCPTGCVDATDCEVAHECVMGMCTPISSGEIRELDVSTFDYNYTSTTASRGYWFTAPANFTIVSLHVPTDVGTEEQNIQVVKLNVEPPPFSMSTTDYTTLFYQKSAPANDWLVVDLNITEGNIIGILGTRGTTTMNNSYGADSGYASTLTVLGVEHPMSLKRFLYQGNINAGPAGAVSTEASSFARIEMRYKDPAP